MSLIKNWRIWILFAVILAAFSIIAFQGINYGIDFSGGTLFQVHLSEKVQPEEMERITTVIAQRLNWTGLKDTKVYSWGSEFVVVQIAETDPAQVERIESLLKKQGRFEVLIDANTVFTGSDIISVDQSTGIPAFQQSTSGAIWNLPFILKADAAKRFRDMSFHRCQLLGLSQNQQGNFECDFTYFFIDRPIDSVIVIPQEDFSEDEQLFLAGNLNEGIPAGTEISTVLLNIGVPVISFDSNFSEEQLSRLKELSSSKKKAIIPSSLNQQLKEQLISLGFEIIERTKVENQPFIWAVSGLRSIIRLNPSLTGNEPFVERPEESKIVTDLIITGSASDQKAAEKERSETKIILQSGSLPVSVESISKESISPLLGQNFLFLAGIIGIIVLIVVSAIIVLRYRKPKLSIAIIFTSLVEAFCALAFTSFLGNVDLAVIIGIVAAVGTGVDDQIVITDELLKGEADSSESSLSGRVKRAFFIVIAAASTSIATMLPIILFGGAMVKLVGFAIATIIGVLVGVLVTRPAFAEIAKQLLE